MRILDRYMLREFGGMFLFGVAAFTSIFIGADLLFRIAQLLTTYGASVWAVTKVFVFALPRIIVYTFPMSVLMGALMAVAHVSGNSELIVMRTAGQSFRRIAAPIWAVALAISLGTVLFNEYVVPAAMYAYQHTIDYEIKGQLRPQAAEHIVLKDVAGDRLRHLLYARRYDPEERALETVTIQEFEDDRLVRVENAPRAEWRDDHWLMRNGTVYDLAVDSGVERMLYFDEQILPFSEKPADLNNVKKSPDTMTIRELRQAMQAYEGGRVDTTPLAMEMHRRFSLPLASFVFALLGAPLGIRKQRSSSSLGFGISIVVIFLYYALMTFMAALGEGQVLPPSVAIWTPNAVAAAAAFVLLRRVDS